jgi:hypothetical protein
MPPSIRLSAVPVQRQPVEVYVLELSDGRIVSRTAEELTHASDEERIAAGLEPAAPAP